MPRVVASPLEAGFTVVQFPQYAKQSNEEGCAFTAGPICRYTWLYRPLFRAAVTACPIAIRTQVWGWEFIEKHKTEVETFRTFLKEGNREVEPRTVTEI
jgi:hypothetical protein